MMSDVLRAAGVDLSTEKTVDHWVIFANEGAATKAADELRNSGFAVTVTESTTPKGPSAWFLTATTNTALNAMQHAAYVSAIKSFAAEYGGEYDGWGVSLK